MDTSPTWAYLNPLHHQLFILSSVAADLDSGTRRYFMDSDILPVPSTLPVSLLPASEAASVPLKMIESVHCMTQKRSPATCLAVL